MRTILTALVCFGDSMTSTTIDFTSEWCRGPGICTAFPCPARLVSAAGESRQLDQFVNNMQEILVIELVYVIDVPKARETNFLEVNALQEVTEAVVEAARESLVIGEAWTTCPVTPLYVRVTENNRHITSKIATSGRCYHSKQSIGWNGCHLFGKRVMHPPKRSLFSPAPLPHLFKPVHDDGDLALASGRGLAICPAAVAELH